MAGGGVTTTVNNVLVPYRDLAIDGLGLVMDTAGTVGFDYLFSIVGATVTEGNSGTTSLVFNVSRTGGTAAFSVDYFSTDSSSPTANEDYIPVAGTLQFAEGELTKSIIVTVYGDVAFERSEDVVLFLTDATNGATVDGSIVVGTIQNDDVDHPSTLTAPDIAATHGQVMAATALFDLDDIDYPAGVPMTYWFRDNTPGGGHFELDGVAQVEGQTFGITEEQLSHLTFRAGAGGTDSITINTWDGLQSSNVVTFNVNVAPNSAPALTAPDRSATHGQVIAASSLFTASDADSDALSYWFSDNTVGGGRFEYDGVAQAEGQTFGVSQSQLSHLTFRAGAGGLDNISLNVWDGQASSSVVAFSVIVEANHAPTLTAPDFSATRGEVIAAADLFSGTDADSDALSYWFRDDTVGGGRFEYDGVAQAEGQTFGVSQSQLSHLTFRAGASGADNISLNLWDGQAASSVAHFQVAVEPNHAPALTAPDLVITHGKVTAAADLFTASDAEGDTLSYWFRDNTVGGGHFEYDGVAQAEGQTFGVSQAQLAHLTFRAGAGGSDNISLNVWDGQASSSVETFDIAVAPNSAPALTTVDRELTHNGIIGGATLAHATDADDDAVSYWFLDNTIGGGHFEYDGVAQVEGQTFGVSEAQLFHLIFRAGASAGSDSISINAWDGQASSGITTITVDTLPNQAPIMFAPDVNASPGQVIAAATFMGVTEPDGDPLTYWFRDNTPGGGRFEYDGVAQAEGQTFGVSQAQLSHLTFRASATAGSDDLFVNAWDGQASSSVVEFHVFV